MKFYFSSLLNRVLPVALGLSCIFAIGFATSQTEEESNQILPDPPTSPQQVVLSQPGSQELETEATLSNNSPTDVLQFILMSKPEATATTTTSTGEAMLGVHVRKANKTLRSHLKIKGQFGLVVEHITADSAAEQAKLQVHDLLYKLDGQILINIEQLQTLIDAKQPGDEIEIEYYRNGDLEEITIELTERKVAAIDSSLDWLNNYHRDLLLNAVQQKGDEGKLANPHNIAAQLLECQACHQSPTNFETVSEYATRQIIVPLSMITGSGAGTHTKPPKPKNDAESNSNDNN